MSLATPRRPASPPPVATVPRMPPRGAVVPFLLAAFAALALASTARAQPAGDVAAGQALYEAKCGGCHSVDENRIGPRHRDVVGRPVASLADYDYSAAIKKLGGVWAPARLDQWLQGPQMMAPGAKMFLAVSDPEQRKSIITYLSSVSVPK
jgi:cytochrome c